MPIPKPTPSENHAQFINRCMSDSTMEREYPDNGQRMAICETQWGTRKDDGRDTNNQRVG